MGVVSEERAEGPERSPRRGRIGLRHGEHPLTIDDAGPAAAWTSFGLAMTGAGHLNFRGSLLPFIAQPLASVVLPVAPGDSDEGSDESRSTGVTRWRSVMALAICARCSLER